MCGQVNCETNIWQKRLTHLLLFLVDGNQALAAEPDFHRDLPRGGGLAVTTVGYFSEQHSELLEQQPENVLAQMFGVVMEDGASGTAFEGAPGTVIEFMGCDFHRQNKILGHFIRGLPALIQRGFQVADVFSYAPL